MHVYLVNAESYGGREGGRQRDRGQKKQKLGMRHRQNTRGGVETKKRDTCTQKGREVERR